MVQYSRGLNASISFSRSTISRRAGLCTRPAERPRVSMRDSSGERVNPSSRSMQRRAFCAFTSGMETSRGSSTALLTALRVIWLKATR